MPTGTFTIGQFTGSRMNSLAGNPALVYIKEFSTSGTTNPQFTDCFSLKYASYQIVFKGGSSTNGVFQMCFLQNTTALGNVHDYGINSVVYASGSTNSGASGQARINLWNHGGITSSFGFFTVQNPFVAGVTTNLEVFAEGGGTNYSWGFGRTSSTVRVNGFQMFNSGGGTVNGAVYVYGIRS
jgi:hypothetical protein